MTTKVIKQELPSWAKGLPKSPIFRRFADLLGISLDTALQGVYWLITTGFIGAALIVFAPYAINLPELLGRTFASWCLERGSCDLTTNLTSVALGAFLTIAICVFLITLFGEKPVEKQSVYYDVLRELETAGELGVTPVEIAKRSGHELSDVHTILAYLYDDARTAILEGSETDRRVRYKYVSSQ